MSLSYEYISRDDVGDGATVRIAGVLVHVVYYRGFRLHKAWVDGREIASGSKFRTCVNAAAKAVQSTPPPRDGEKERG